MYSYTITCVIFHPFHYFPVLTIRNKMSASHPFYFMWSSGYGFQIIIEIELLSQSMWIFMRSLVHVSKFPSRYFYQCVLYQDVTSFQHLSDNLMD